MAYTGDFTQRFQEGLLKVEVGRDVALRVEEELWIVRIVCYSPDGCNEIFFRRFYRIGDLFSCGQHGLPTTAAQDERQLFLDEFIHHKSHSTFAIDREVLVTWVHPGNQVPELPEHGYWFMHSFCSRGFTIKDYGHIHVDRWAKYPLRAVDLYCGCGGLSFISNTSFAMNENPVIKSIVGVDANEDACCSFQINHQDAKVHKMSVQEFLLTCKHLDLLHEQNLEMTAKGEKITGVKLCWNETTKDDGLSEENTSIELCIDRNWMNRDDADGAAVSYREQLGYPMQGEVDIIMGGPPCQEVSSANCKAPKKNIMGTARNHEVVRFYDAVEYFQPKFVLMENVPDIMKRRKDEGAYFKYALLRLVNLGYQVRAGVVAAGDHGAAQVRQRCFIWGAKSGEVLLPSFPKPMFKIPPEWKSATEELMKDCMVSLQEEDYNSPDVFPMVTIGDLVGDLREVSPFSASEVCTYRDPPMTPMQKWLRRKLPNAEQRWEDAERYMHGLRDARLSIVEDICMKFGEECRIEGDQEADNLVWERIGEDLGFIAGESKLARRIREDLDPHISGWEREKADDIFRERSQALNREIGKMITDSLDKELEDLSLPHSQLVRGHVTYLNSVWYERIKLIPRGDGNRFTSAKGIQHTGGRGYCAGNIHSCGKEEGELKMGFDEGSVYVYMSGCSSRNYFLSSGQLSCIKYMLKKPSSSYRRFNRYSVVKTLLGTVEPHAIFSQGLLHPFQHRCLTVLECKRIQGFPDEFCLVGGVGKEKRSKRGRKHMKSRYQQIGNAVSPHVAEALGRCLMRAANGGWPTDFIEDVSEWSEMKWALTDAVRLDGLKFFSPNSGTVIELSDSDDSDDDDDNDGNHHNHNHNHNFDDEGDAWGFH